MTRLAALAAVSVLLAGCPAAPAEPTGPDLAACKAAMVRQFDYQQRTAGSPDRTSVRPGECQGVSDADLERLVGEILDDATSSVSTPEPDTNTGRSLYYESCAQARAAGAQLPIRRGDRGYRPGLDRDGDGVACDR